MIPTTFSVPPRRPRSWCPPWINASSSIPLRMTRPPAPFRAFTLCPEKVSMSTGIAMTDPVSLFAYMTETRTVSGVSAFRTESGSTIPYRFTGTYVTRNPFASRNRQLFITAGGVTLAGGRGLSRVPFPERPPLEREVVALGPGAREHDLQRLTPEKGGDFLPRVLHLLAHVPARPVDARGVPELLGQVRFDRFPNLGMDGRRRVVVEIDFSHASASRCFPAWWRKRFSIVMESRNSSMRVSSVSHMFCVLHRSIIPHFRPELRHPTRAFFPSAARMISPIVISEGRRARMNPPPGPRTLFTRFRLRRRADRGWGEGAESASCREMSLRDTGLPRDAPARLTSAITAYRPRVVIFTGSTGLWAVPSVLRDASSPRPDAAPAPSPAR